MRDIELEKAIEIEKATLQRISKEIDPALYCAGKMATYIDMTYNCNLRELSNALMQAQVWSCIYNEIMLERANDGI